MDTHCEDLETGVLQSASRVNMVRTYDLLQKENLTVLQEVKCYEEALKLYETVEKKRS
jgi:hypothetical protein